MRAERGRVARGLRLHQLRRRDDRHRATRTRSRASCCASARNQPAGEQPRASARTYTIPGPDAPNGANLFPPTSQAVLDGKAKPEIFAMGVRNLYSIDVDDKTDKIAAAWVGPDQGTNSVIWGPAKTENAVLINSAGNYGWPFCTGNQQGYRAKLPVDDRRRPAGPGRPPRHGRR